MAIFDAKPEEIPALLNRIKGTPVAWSRLGEVIHDRVSTGNDEGWDEDLRTVSSSESKWMDPISLFHRAQEGAEQRSVGTRTSRRDECED